MARAIKIDVLYPSVAKAIIARALKELIIVSTLYDIVWAQKYIKTKVTQNSMTNPMM